MIKIIYEDNHILVIEKPPNIPMVLDNSGDLDLLTMAKNYIKLKYNKNGQAFLGVVHRLDRPVAGVCVFAKTSKAASRISEKIRTNKFKKTYIAVVEDNNLKKEDVFEDYLLKNNKTNTTTVNLNGKFSKLEYKILERKNNYAKVLINLHTGRSHQIRVQFSSRNHSLYGDQKYNKNAKVGQQIALFSHKICFEHPTIKKEMCFSLEPKNIYPYNIFKGANNEDN